jgi:hypothetical protein
MIVHAAFRFLGPILHFWPVRFEVRVQPVFASRNDISRLAASPAFDPFPSIPPILMASC